MMDTDQTSGKTPVHHPPQLARPPLRAGCRPGPTSVQPVGQLGEVPVTDPSFVTVREHASGTACMIRLVAFRAVLGCSQGPVVIERVAGPAAPDVPELGVAERRKP